MMKSTFLKAASIAAFAASIFSTEADAQLREQDVALIAADAAQAAYDLKLQPLGRKELPEGMEEGVVIRDLSAPSHSYRALHQLGARVAFENDHADTGIRTLGLVLKNGDVVFGIRGTDNLLNFRTDAFWVHDALGTGTKEEKAAKLQKAVQKLIIGKHPLEIAALHATADLALTAGGVDLSKIMEDGTAYAQAQIPAALQTEYATALATKAAGHAATIAEVEAHDLMRRTFEGIQADFAGFMEAVGGTTKGDGGKRNVILGGHSLAGALTALLYNDLVKTGEDEYGITIENLYAHSFNGVGDVPALGLLELTPLSESQVVTMHPNDFGGTLKTYHLVQHRRAHDVVGQFPLREGTKTAPVYYHSGKLVNYTDELGPRRPLAGMETSAFGAFPNLSRMHVGAVPVLEVAAAEEDATEAARIAAEASAKVEDEATEPPAAEPTTTQVVLANTGWALSTGASYIGYGCTAAWSALKTVGGFAAKPVSVYTDIGQGLVTNHGMLPFRDVMYQGYYGKSSRTSGKAQFFFPGGKGDAIMKGPALISLQNILNPTVGGSAEDGAAETKSTPPQPMRGAGEGVYADATATPVQAGARASSASKPAAKATEEVVTAEQLAGDATARVTTPGIAADADALAVAVAAEGVAPGVVPHA